MFSVVLLKNLQFSKKKKNWRWVMSFCGKESKGLNSYVIVLFLNNNTGLGTFHLCFKGTLCDGIETFFAESTKFLAIQFYSHQIPFPSF